MPRVALVHWKPEEARPRLDAIRAAGFDVLLAPHPAAPEWKNLRAAPPDAFVIDLDRLPSHGRAAGAVLRRQKSTRRVPLVFAGGLPEKTEKAREVFPDAHFTAWTRIGPALRKAIGTRLEAPVIPAMGGSPRASLTKRLGIQEGSTVALIGAPPRFDRTLEPLPEGVRLREGARAEAAGVALLFVSSSLELARRFEPAAATVAPGGKFWIVWPKRASGVETDLSMTFLRAFAMDAGWVDYRVCAVDAAWSGMLFARRKSGTHGA